MTIWPWQQSDAFSQLLHRFQFFEDMHDKRIVLLAIRQCKQPSMDQLYRLTKQCNCFFENQGIFKTNFRLEFIPYFTTYT